MKPIAWIFLPFALVLIQSLVSAASSSSSSGSQSSDEAYVTLLYGDEFLLGVRVLGKSIRDTGSNKDMVALISDGVSEYAKKLLEVSFYFAFLFPTNSSYYYNLSTSTSLCFFFFSSEIVVLKLNLLDTSNSTYMLIYSASVWILM